MLRRPSAFSVELVSVDPRLRREYSAPAYITGCLSSSEADTYTWYFASSSAIVNSISSRTVYAVVEMFSSHDQNK